MSNPPVAFRPTLYRYNGQEHLARQAEQDLETLQIQVQTNIGIHSTLGNRFQIKASAADGGGSPDASTKAAQMIDRFREGVQDEDLQDLGIHDLAQLQIVMGNVERDLAAARATGNSKMAEGFDARLRHLHFIEQRLLFVGLPVLQRQTSAFQQAGAVAGQLWRAVRSDLGNITPAEVVVKPMTGAILPILAGVSVAGYADLMAKFAYTTLMGEHDTSLLTTHPIETVAVGSALGLIMRYPLGRVWRESWSHWRDLANGNDLARHLHLYSAMFISGNTVAGAWNAGMGLAKELGVAVPDFFYAHYGHGDGFSRSFFGLSLAVATIGTATRLANWWKALTNNTSR